MVALRRKETVSTRSPIWDLGPVLDERGILRSAGRVTHAPTVNSPILLPAKCSLTRLIVLFNHESVFHSGVKATFTEIRRQFWVVKCRATGKSLLAQCLVCKHHKVLPYLLVQSALSECLVTERAPFQAIGMDFAGPIFRKGGTPL